MKRSLETILLTLEVIKMDKFDEIMERLAYIIMGIVFPLGIIWMLFTFKEIEQRLDDIEKKVALNAGKEGEK